MDSSRFVFFQAEDGIRDLVRSRGLGDVYKRQLHSLAIAKFIDFKKGSRIFDLGTGGGFPGIPLAIIFPDVFFTLADGTVKKILVVNEIIQYLGLSNAKGIAQRAEEVKDTFDFVVTRAVAKIDKILPWSRRIVHSNHKNSYPNGLIALKGCLLYTSDAADERSSVDLGGRRIIKKKNKERTHGGR